MHGYLRWQYSDSRVAGLAGARGRQHEIPRCNKTHDLTDGGQRHRGVSMHMSLHSDSSNKPITIVYQAPTARLKPRDKP